MKEAIIYDDILNKFQHLKTPYIICTLVADFIYNDILDPIYLSHVVSTIFGSDLPECLFDRD